jgi:hypothetical protein
MILVPPTLSAIFVSGATVVTTFKGEDRWAHTLEPDSIAVRKASAARKRTTIT